MNDDFDNEMGLPEDELGGGSASSDSGDLGLGGMDAEDEMESQPGRPSGGARAKPSGGRPRKRTAAPAARKSAKRKAAGGGKKKGARKAARKGSRKAARKGSTKSARGRKKAGRHR
jgi:hypothetical protein